MSETTDNLALATVVDDDYLPGALVMLDSFHQHHPVFRGPLVIIHDESLSSRSIRILNEAFDRVKLHHVRETCRRNIKRLVAAKPQLKTRSRRFYSLDIFAMPFPERILFCDSDLVFQAEINEFLKRPESFVATPDRAVLAGRYFGDQTPSNAPCPSSFNSGLMLVSRQCRTPEIYQALQAKLSPESWTNVTTGHTDQRVLNQHFAEQVHFMNNRFNYLMHCQETLQQDHHLMPDGAQVLHFSNSLKPWETSRITTASALLQNYYPVAMKAWHRAYDRMMQRRVEQVKSKSLTPKFRGANYDLSQLIRHHLFVISPNNSGSTWVKNILATSQQTWNLTREGQHTFGVSGPNTFQSNAALVWAAKPETLSVFADPAAYNWDINRRAWYFQAHSLTPHASVFVEKSPPYLTQVSSLKQSFKNPHFIFLTRNPYAVAESILRKVASLHKNRYDAINIAARHIIACFKIQRDNILEFGRDNIVISYEEMCRAPEALGQHIQQHIPILNDIDYHKVIEVKGYYYESLRDMNAQQINRLSEADRVALEEHFHPVTELLAFFGYSPDCPSY